MNPLDRPAELALLVVVGIIASMLGIGGESGVHHVLELMCAELGLDLMLCGLASPAEVTRGPARSWVWINHP